MMRSASRENGSVWQPDPAGAGHRREEQTLAAEQRRPDAAHELDVVLDRRIEGNETAGIDMSALSFERCQTINRAKDGGNRSG